MQVTGTRFILLLFTERKTTMARQSIPIDIVHSIACGMDIHKEFLIAVICDATDPDRPVFIKKRFSTFSKSLRELSDWLVENHCFYVCMESTGNFWKPIFNVLEEKMVEVRICNPKWVKQVKGEKDDTNDAYWICNQYRLGLTRSSYIPAKDIRELRSLTRQKKKWREEITSETNRAINVLVDHNYRLDMVFSSMNVKSARKIISILVSKDSWTNEDILKCVHKRCKAAREDILEAVKGIKLSEAMKYKLQAIMNHVDYLQNQLAEMHLEIDKLAEPHQEEIKALMTMPGVGRDAAICIIAEIGTDMSEFKNPARLAKWAGLAPGSNESAGKKFSRSVTKAGKYLKPCLVQCAWAAVKAKVPYYLAKFNAISRRAGKKRAIVAIARKMLTSIWAMLTYGSDWAPRDMTDSGYPRETTAKSAKNKLQHAISDLACIGKSKEEITAVVTSIIEAEAFVAS